MWLDEAVDGIQYYLSLLHLFCLCCALTCLLLATIWYDLIEISERIFLAEDRRRISCTQHQRNLFTFELTMAAVTTLIDDATI